MTSDATQTAPSAARGPAVGTAAVVLATAPASGDDAPSALLPCEGTTILGRLLDQLASLGAGEIHVITRPRWEGASRAAAPLVRVEPSADLADDLRRIGELAAAGRGPLVVAHGDVIAHREALAGLRAGARGGTAILAAGGRRGDPLAFDVRGRRGRLLSAASPYHATGRPTSSFLGVIEVSPADRPALASAAAELAALADDPPAAWRDELERKGGGAAAREDAVSLLLVGLVRRHAQVRPRDVRGLVCERALSADRAGEIAARAAAADVDRLLLDAAVKSSDGFFTTFFVSSYSRYIVRWAARRGLRPNQITLASAVIGLAAAAAFATGERWGLIAGALLLQAAFTADCVDGQLARYTRSSSSLGAWLDSILDRGKEYAAYAGLAIGASAAGDPVWVLASCTLALQTLSHMSDQAFITANRQAAATTRQPPLAQPDDGLGAASGAGATSAAAAPANRPAAAPTRGRAAVGWLKRILAFPIGERFAAISITAALFTPRTTFVVLLAWSGFAACYTLSARILRSISR